MLKIQVALTPQQLIMLSDLVTDWFHDAESDMLDTPEHGDWEELDDLLTGAAKDIKEINGNSDSD